MFKILDRYIIKRFLGSFILAISLIISIAVIFDLSEHLTQFIDNKVPFREIFLDYYINFVPYYANLFMFLFVFISVIFFTSKMASKSEIIAIISSGISFFRLLVPYMIAASVIAAFSWYLGNFVIPPGNKKRVDFEEKYFYHRNPYSVRNVHKQVAPGVFLYIQFYDIRADIAHTFSLETIEDGVLKSKLLAKYARWDTVKKSWILFDYYIRKYYDTYDKMTFGKKTDTTLNITPEYFKRFNLDITTLTLPQLNRFIEQEKLRGSENINSYLLEKYKRTAYPFSTFILTFLGVTISSKKKRGGTSLNIGLGLLLSFAYIFFMQVSDQFSIKGGMNPLLAVWIPNIIFTIISFISYYIFAPR